MPKIYNLAREYAAARSAMSPQDFADYVFEQTGRRIHRQIAKRALDRYCPDLPRLTYNESRKQRTDRLLAPYDNISAAEASRQTGSAPKTIARSRRRRQQ